MLMDDFYKRKHLDSNRRGPRIEPWAARKQEEHYERCDFYREGRIWQIRNEPTTATSDTNIVLQTAGQDSGSTESKAKFRSIWIKMESRASSTASIKSFETLTKVSDPWSDWKPDWKLSNNKFMVKKEMLWDERDFFTLKS